MTIARERLVVRIGSQLWLTEGGMETELVFHDGIDLPCFAAFTLLDSDAGRERLVRYATEYLDVAAKLGRGHIMDTHTWRASHGWGVKMGLSAKRIAEINADSVRLLQSVRARRGAQADKILINGVVGPSGDGYAPETQMTLTEACDYPQPQIDALAAAGVDLVTVMTMTHVEEAIGVTEAARAADVPFACSFTVETDGNLPSGMPLREAITRVDDATDGWPMWFGINCAHPDHFRDRLTGAWVARIGALRANASRKSHAELDCMEELDAGDPLELGQDYAGLLQVLPGLRVVGGCCGTDLRHVTTIGVACAHRMAV